MLGPVKRCATGIDHSPASSHSVTPEPPTQPSTLALASSLFESLSYRRENVLKNGSLPQVYFGNDLHARRQMTSVALQPEAERIRIKSPEGP